MAVILCALVGFAIIGGVKSITRVSEILVPFMAIFYVLGCLVILIMNSGVIAGETKKYAGKHIDDMDDSEIPIINNAKKAFLCDHIPLERDFPFFDI